MDAADSQRPPRSTAITALAILAVLYTLYFAREFLLPITFALLLDFLLGPAVRALARLRIPVPLGAGVVVLAMVGLVGLGVYQLSGPVQSWGEKAPQTIATAQAKLKKLLKPLEQMTKTAQQVESAAGGVSGASKAPEVVVAGPTVASRLFGSTQRFLAGALEVLILLYFLLAAGDLFLAKLIKLLPHFSDKVKAIQIARATEASISLYLRTTAVINLIEGAMVAGAMQLLGMPNALLWGGLAALFEFIPYLGAAAMLAILSVAALATFPEVGHALLVPGAFLATNLIQANLVSPMLLGHRLALNPVALFIGLAFWFWIWGVPGAFIAVPLLATLKICGDHIDALAPLGEFLGRRDGGNHRPALSDPPAG
jgi:predicted PurR-regulated permease PerM